MIDRTEQERLLIIFHCAFKSIIIWKVPIQSGTKSFTVLTVVTERGTQSERWTEDDRQTQRREEFTWTWLKYSSLPHIKLWNGFRTLGILCTKTLWCFIMFLWLSWGLTITQNSIRTISDLDRSHLIDTRSGRKWPYRSRYRYWVSDRCIPNTEPKNN